MIAKRGAGVDRRVHVVRGGGGVDDPHDSLGQRDRGERETEQVGLGSARRGGRHRERRDRVAGRRQVVALPPGSRVGLDRRRLGVRRRIAGRVRVHDGRRRTLGSRCREIGAEHGGELGARLRGRLRPDGSGRVGIHSCGRLGRAGGSGCRCLGGRWEPGRGGRRRHRWRWRRGRGCGVAAAGALHAWSRRPLRAPPPARSAGTGTGGGGQGRFTLLALDLGRLPTPSTKVISMTFAS